MRSASQPLGLEYGLHIEGSQGKGADRAAVLRHEGYLVVTLADGSGGTRAGAQAAEQVLQRIERLIPEVEPRRLGTAAFWVDALEDCDRMLTAQGHGGEAAVVVLATDGEHLVGASQGDASAWVFDAAGLRDLTTDQTRKPLVGAGCPSPHSFEATLGNGTLLVASDGLPKYARLADIRSVACSAFPIAETVRRLADAARLRSGGLQDDLSVVLLRPASLHHRSP